VALLGLSQPFGLQQLLEGAQQLSLTVQHVRMDGPYQAAQYLAALQAMTAHQAQAVMVPDQPEHGPIGSALSS